MEQDAKTSTHTRMSRFADQAGATAKNIAAVRNVKSPSRLKKTTWLGTKARFTRRSKNGAADPGPAKRRTADLQPTHTPDPKLVIHDRSSGEKRREPRGEPP